jgi:hypothetical protein
MAVPSCPAAGVKLDLAANLADKHFQKATEPDRRQGFLQDHIRWENS